MLLAERPAGSGGNISLPQDCTLPEKPYENWGDVGVSVHFLSAMLCRCHLRLLELF